MKLALDQRLVSPYGYHMQARHILAYPELWERLGDWAWLVARKAGEHHPGYATRLVAGLEHRGAHERADQLRRLAEANTPVGSCRHEKGSDTYLVVGGGAGFWGTIDEFHFAHKRLIGDGSITARMETLEGTSERARAGIMIRTGLDPKDPFAAVVTPGTGVRFATRLLLGHPTIEDDHLESAEQKTVQAPVWLRMERKGNQFSAFYSSDGKTWTRMVWSPQTIVMPASVYIGLAVTSRDNNRTAEARFSHVTTAGEVSPPGPFTRSQDIRPEAPASPDATVANDCNDK